jgi:hypothetical protein
VGEESCPKCGVIFAKVRSTAVTPSLPSPAPLDPAARLLLAVRVIFLLCLAYYTFRLLSHSIASNYLGETFLHLVNLPFHEAGHILFSPFGRFLQVAGGTLMQLIVPAVVALSFLKRGDRLGAAVGIWWFGESVADVAPYADDARAGQIPLVGGVTGSEVEDYHDWEVMLTKLNLLSWDHAIGRVFFVMGGALMITGIVFGVVATLRQGRGGKETEGD